MHRSRTHQINRRAIALAFLCAAAVLGFGVVGWKGALLFPIALTIGGFALLIGLHVIDFALTLHAQSVRISGLPAKLKRLSPDQLLPAGTNPSHPHFALALAELSGRGIDVPGRKQTLLNLLTSPNPTDRGRAMSLLAAFHPELRFSDGATSQDPAEVWRRRIESMG